LCKKPCSPRRLRARPLRQILQKLTPAILLMLLQQIFLIVLLWHAAAAFVLQQCAKSVRSAPASTAALRSTAEPQEITTQEQLFTYLVQQSGVAASVELAQTAAGYRGLVAAQDIAQGQHALQVSASLCLWADRDGVVQGLQGQTDFCWEQAGDLREPVSDELFAKGTCKRAADTVSATLSASSSNSNTRYACTSQTLYMTGLTWDLRLALALQDALCDPSVGGDFWQAYGQLLPAPHEITVPFCLSEALLQQMQHMQLARRAAVQKLRLKRYDCFRNFACIL
jgi:hypothetical protein